MKKNDCGVVQDLMPLVLDRVGSDESRALVERHIETCAECKKQYDAMKAELPGDTRQAFEEEQKNLMDALKAVRKKKRKRCIIAVFLAFAVCIAAAFGGTLAYNRLYLNPSVMVKNDQYALSLVRLRDGRIVVNSQIASGLSSTSTNIDEVLIGGERIMYCYYTTTPIHETYPDMKDKACLGILAAGDLDTLQEIRQGKPDDYVTVWKRGDEIPAASEEMETFYALEKEFDALLLSRADEEGKPYRADAAFFTLQDRLQEAWRAVPEWN